MNPIPVRISSLFLALAWTFALIGTSSPKITQAALPQQDFLGSRTSRFEGVTYDFRLTKTALLAAPKWKSGSDFPPLPPKEAEKKARTQLQSLLPDKCSFMQISSITLEKLFDEDWIYLVTYEYVPPTAYSGEARLFTLPVYLDGNVITPAIKRIKP